ncbi:MAG TPA: hypothetical protein VHV77_06870 [Pirellulales bacterium]|jgi:hypothetical protein|nr:hypothetical protein [Pirellulales bacterium]
MNYYAHGRAWVDNPYYVAGTAIPDWLNVADRSVRARSKHAIAWIDDADPRIASLARGIVQHHHDDAWFHSTEAFGKMQWQITAKLVEALGPDPSLRASFVGHVLVEVLLDWVLIDEEPGGLDAYYRAVESLDPDFVEQTLGTIAGKPCRHLAWFIDRFSHEAFLWDYADDGKLWFRMNQVMRRVRLAELPEPFVHLLPEARRLVRHHRTQLLTPSENMPNVRGQAPRLNGKASLLRGSS